jgi:hypothetical protein
MRLVEPVEQTRLLDLKELTVEEMAAVALILLEVVERHQHDQVLVAVAVL